MVFEIVTNKKFDMIIMIFIGLNMLTMTLDHYNMTEEWKMVLDYLNLVFICIFTSECVLKVFALRWHYFKEPWNLFDFVVVIMSILGKKRDDVDQLSVCSDVTSVLSVSSSFSFFFFFPPPLFFSIFDNSFVCSAEFYDSKIYKNKRSVGSAAGEQLDEELPAAG